MPDDVEKNVAFVSLGCPKALVDAEHIVAALGASGYSVVGEEEGADVVVVNTCGFIDAAQTESYDAIERALAARREVVVTGCLGADARALKARYPELKFVSPPAKSEPVVAAVQQYLPVTAPSRTLDTPATRPADNRVQLTPEHYAYLKISEGCNHRCTFCIIPSMRGDLVSRPLNQVLDEAHQLVAGGVRELLLVAQDLSAYGIDMKYAQTSYEGRQRASRLFDLCEALAAIAPWVRLHYVYPYPHVERVVELMADGKILPYLDMPLQHAAPHILQAMRRPAAAERTLERIRRWREICPELVIRSTFIVGFPGESETDLGTLLDFLEAAQLDRVGCFTYSPVAGAAANALPGHIDERDKLDRQERVYEIQQAISAARLKRHVGRRLRALVDEVEGASALGRTMYDAPDIDGVVHIADGQDLTTGQFVWVDVTDADDHDLYGSLAGQALNFA